MGLRDRGIIFIAAIGMAMYASSAAPAGPLGATHAAQGRFSVNRPQAPLTLVLCAHLAATQARWRLISVISAIQGRTLSHLDLRRAHLACPDHGL